MCGQIDAVLARCPVKNAKPIANRQLSNRHGRGGVLCAMEKGAAGIGWLIVPMVWKDAVMVNVQPNITANVSADELHVRV